MKQKSYTYIKVIFMIIYTYFTLSFYLRSRHFSILVSIIGTCRFVTTETECMNTGLIAELKVSYKTNK